MKIVKKQNLYAVMIAAAISFTACSSNVNSNTHEVPNSETVTEDIDIRSNAITKKETAKEYIVDFSTGNAVVYHSCDHVLVNESFSVREYNRYAVIKDRENDIDITLSDNYLVFNGKKSELEKFIRMYTNDVDLTYYNEIFCEDDEARVLR